MSGFTPTTERYEQPYVFAVAQNLLSAELRLALLAQWPELSCFERHERHSGGDKNYGMYVLPLVERGRPGPSLAKVGNAWGDLVALVDSPNYRAWLAETVGVDGDFARTDIGLFEFGPGDGVSPHTDKPIKAATHVLYLNDFWSDDYGGAFEVRSDGDPHTAPVVRVLPGLGRSVVFARSDRSWHAVTPVAECAPQHRLTIQVEMWRC